MAYNVVLKPSVYKALENIPLADRKRIGKKIDQLAENARSRGVEKLAEAENRCRVRVGDYRIVYEIHDNALLIVVVRIGKRGDVCRGLP
jgi:mRNA interferase RelE/StbE